MESDLVNLKAIVHNHKADVKKFGVNHKAEKKTNKSRLSLSNAGVCNRAHRDELQHEQEQKTLSKSKSILEEKAALYEKLHSGVSTLEDCDLNEKYLVNFQKKIIDEVTDRKKTREESLKREATASLDNYPADTPDEEWVEYTDALGRTRMCQKRDLPAMKEQDNYITEGTQAGPSEPLTAKEEAYNAEMKYIETQRLKWEAEEAGSKMKSNIHYSDVLFNEARTHGVGFMKLSQDEKKRKEQLEFLNELRSDAEVAAAIKAKSDAKKQKSMKARLEKVREKKRLKMGLPIKDKSLDSPTESDEEIGPPLPPLIKDDDASAREDNDSKIKEVKLREWDVGKERIMNEMSQEEWVQKNRKERNPDFAPPSQYKRDFNRYKVNKNINFTPHQSSSQCDYDVTNAESSSQDKNWAFAPPTTYEYYGPTTNKNKKSSYY